MTDPKTLNQFLSKMSKNDKIHKYMDELLELEIRMRDGLTNDNVTHYFGKVTEARSYCEDVGYNKYNVVEKYFKSLHSQCLLMLQVLSRNNLNN